MTQKLLTNIEVDGNLTATGTLRLTSGADITFGASADTDLYRLAANSLATDGEFTAFGGLSAGGNKITSLSPGVNPTDAATVSQITTGGGGTSVLDWVNVVTLGADPTGVTACDTIVNNAITALGSQGGVIYFPTGTYKVSTGIVAHLADNQSVTIIGDGGIATLLKYFGTGDCIRMFNSSTFVQNANNSFFSGIHNLAIDGTNATGGVASGIHAGDITFVQIQDVYIENFAVTGQKGVWLDNTVVWTEQGDYRIGISNCDSGMVLEVTTGFESFGYSSIDLTVFNHQPEQTFFALKNGAVLYHGSLRIRGDAQGSATALTGHPAVIAAFGVAPVGSQVAGQISTMLSMQLDVLVEPNDSGGSTPHILQTFFLDPVNGGNIINCYGQLDFSDGSGAFSPITAGALTGDSGFFSAFSGIIVGDVNLNPTGDADWRVYGTGTMLNTLASAKISDGNFRTVQADAFWTTLTANATVSLNPAGVNDPSGNNATFAGPQRKILFIQQDTTGSRILTWPVNASPTTASPTVKWPGGTAPTLQTAANAVDIIELLTWDGATWYGRSLTAVNSGTSFTGGTLTQFLAPDVVTLTFGTTIAVNAALGNAFNLTLTASTGTISNPTNSVDGQVIRFRIKQDATGSRTVAWGTNYDFGTGTTPTLTTTAGKVDIVAFEFVSSITKWCCLGSGLGF